MKLCDVNVLVYAHREDSTPDHPRHAEWLRELVAAPSQFGLSEAVLSGFIRVVSNPRIFRDPTPPKQALEFCHRLRKRPNARILRPGRANWEIFSRLCEVPGIRGKLVADAWHAALAIEYGCQWISTDRDFARFPGLDWCRPFD